MGIISNIFEGTFFFSFVIVIRKIRFLSCLFPTWSFNWKKKSNWASYISPSDLFRIVAGCCLFFLLFYDQLKSINLWNRLSSLPYYSSPINYLSNFNPFQNSSIQITRSITKIRWIYSEFFTTMLQLNLAVKVQNTILWRIQRTITGFMD